MKFPLVVAATALTAFCWGVYGPVLHIGQKAMGGSSLRPFICVGLAYFVIAVLVPLFLLWTKGEKGSWTASGTIWSLMAGAAGALGALGIIMAFKFRGSPVYVMPLVFGCAPVVNTFTTMWMSKTTKEAGMLFYLGVLVAALGAAGVMYNKPVSKAGHGPEKNVAAKSESHDEAEKSADTKVAVAAKPSPSLTYWEMLMIPLSIALTAFSWGAYGPVLHQGQMKMSGSRLRPLLCVGLAYFAIAVVVPVFALGIWDEPGRFFGDSGDFWLQFGGTVWSLAAGAAGAIGALGIIMAFNFGGKPVFVMPLVFGCAPIVNTFTTIIKEDTGRNITPAFMISMLIAIVGAVMVLVFSPKAHPPKPAGGDAKKDSHATAPAKAQGSDMSPDDAMRHIDTLLSHVWMVRTFLKHSDEAAEDDELAEVHRELYDYMLALGAPFNAGDATEYLRFATKKFAKLKRATEQFAKLQPEISTHMNFRMASQSLRTAVAEVGEIVEKISDRDEKEV